ncbi:phosphoheptose isomerase [Candidatus Gracilibacteria bacterium]|nr:MAG: phosphoheptose isomerase [Candidatus Gracilibacteria bacterium]
MSISQFFLESAEVKKDFIAKNEPLLLQIIDMMESCLQKGNKILIAGNGGSAADSQHWAAELIGRYKLDRKSLPAIALTTDTSILTAIGNDYGYDEVFSKQVEGLGQEGDIFVGISTSGNSGNILKAIEKAKENGLTPIGLTGRDGGKMHEKLDYNLIVPSDNTPRIQECHLCIYHTICEEIENRMFG